jgi:predicted alpha/beta hydrolase family esterase
MIQQSIICVHGYGVRGFFWKPARTELEKLFSKVIVPDLGMNTVDSAVLNLINLVEAECEKSKQAVILMGHSLGGIISALVTKRLGPGKVSNLIIIASPYGVKSKGIGPVVRFLIKNKLMPAWLIRPRFFGSRTDVSIQKELFAQAVPETEELQSLVTRRPWFHVEELSQDLRVKTLGIASKADQIVRWTETKEFTDALNGQFYVFEKEEDIGHDDFTVHAPTITRFISVLQNYFTNNK